MKKYTYIKKNHKGFTLIETLVSLALFSIVLVITGSVIISVLDINKKNQLVSGVVSNLNYSIDSMIRDIKTGYLYRCDYAGTYTIAALKASSPKDGPCTDLTLISTITGEDTVVRYNLIVPTDNTPSYIEKTIYDEDGTASQYSITDKKDVNITALKLYVKTPAALDEIGAGEYGQPSVFVSIKGSAGDDTLEASKFYIQTFISQRLTNITDFKDNI